MEFTLTDMNIPMVEYHECQITGEEINKRLAQPWPSLTPLKFSDGHFQKFKWADTHASKEQSVTMSVIPNIEGDIGDPKCAGVGPIWKSFSLNRWHTGSGSQLRMRDGALQLQLKSLRF
ncbi:hypothetical protein PAAG_11893 [Paracoccidioides lutzii Pb01]|uniref:Uncharacterized protein n=1 Tax=Paracoccidioides lutzii (strain ATCC MYA-826 / Pb01) TaxID=502779 RepID=A0A0A2V0T2_PARBA|nr:hypothetical protein PAAG_11893 [Paracoccidioides lutzii Pb01]KGQ01426.1 hypothetical protein PAAG_11893 [Paracoccidioides lutzii Pb01]